MNPCEDLTFPFFFTLWSTSHKLKQRISQGSRQARRGSEPAMWNLTEHQHRFNRCATGASARACAQSNAGWNSGSVKRKLETLKHFSNRRTTGARTLAHMCTPIPPNRVLARDTDVYLRRFSLLKSSIESSFSSYKDLEETLIKYQRRSWPLFNFHLANKTFHDLLEQPILFLRKQSEYELCLLISSLKTKLTTLVQS